MKTIINIGDLAFCFIGEFSTKILYDYFPDACLDSSDRVGEIIYYIKPSGKLRENIDGNASYEVVNFLGSAYQVYFKNDKKYMISNKNEYGAHVFVEKDNNYEVYYLDENINDDVIWSIRLCRELILNYYISKGYIPIHSSAVSFKNNGILNIGKKHSGKTTTLCTFTKLNSQIISNDLVLLGINSSGDFEMVGWPWKITIGTGLANEMGIPIEDVTFKVEMTPGYFCRRYNCKWKWKEKLSAILLPEVEILGDKFEIGKVEFPYVENYIKDNGIEYSEIYNIFTGNKYSIDFENVIKSVAKDVPCYFMKGNIWGNPKKIIQSLTFQN